jgi:thioredoxin-like negative regulator of GroEL
MAPVSPPLPKDVIVGSSATIVQFSSAFCQPCRATRQVVSRVVRDIAAEGVAVVEIDADDNVEITRAWAVESTPTVVFLDAAGREVHRGSGQPRTADIVAGLGKAIG